MLLLFGITTRTKTLGTGTFYCRNDRGDRNYVLLEARRWFTLFFIPVIPLKVLGEQVQCSSCGVQYGPGVLNHVTPPANDQVTNEELEAFIRTGTERGLSREQLRRLLVEKVDAKVVDEVLRRV